MRGSANVGLCVDPHMLKIPGKEKLMIESRIILPHEKKHRDMI